MINWSCKGGDEIMIRLITSKDYKKVADLIERSINGSAFAKFYPKQSIEYVKESLNEDGVKERASWTHFYVLEENDEMIDNPIFKDIKNEIESNNLDDNNITGALITASNIIIGS